METGKIPIGFVTAKFAILYLYKKGSGKDLGNYRCIVRLNHAYKILSQILLARLTAQCDSFLQDGQAGFRRSRGCRDNTVTLRTLPVRGLLRLGESLTINFVDYTATFDSVSHRFLDKTLVRAGSSNKIHTMVRAVYTSSEAFTTVSDASERRKNQDQSLQN